MNTPDSSNLFIRARGQCLIAEMRVARLTGYSRKLDTRNKIELGGLIIKGGLSIETRVVILGAMLFAKNEIRADSNYRKYLQLLGAAEFMEFDVKDLTQYARKLDTRNKIELGGLVIKGGLSSETKAVILGAMLSAKNELRVNPRHREYLQSLGEVEFLKSDDFDNNVDAKK